MTMVNVGVVDTTTAIPKTGLKTENLKAETPESDSEKRLDRGANYG